MDAKAEPHADAPVVKTADVAHEFRELLTVVLFSLEQLQRQSLDDRGREQLKRAEQAARCLAEAVNRAQPV